ncbi:GPW/gp25 family protein [Halosimplex amylolyticum]|uniref:GPW/gp25 family protein n=1 Tax=Halosimplex amylolyticum TaxID=3396616 RepID=UPI003F56384E
MSGNDGPPRDRRTAAATDGGASRAPGGADARETAEDFLGSGWAFPVETDERGSITRSRGRVDIEESIRLILETAKGERVMRPEFGCGIHDFAFATVDRSTLTLAETSVRDALREWEPRIEVLAVDVSTERLDEGVLLVDVDYRVRETNNEFNLVYPFYLEVS